MIPLYDDNPTRHRPHLTLAFLAICVIVFLWEITGGHYANQERVFRFAAIPLNVTSGEDEAVRVVREYPQRLLRDVRLRYATNEHQLGIRADGTIVTSETTVVPQGAAPPPKYGQATNAERLARSEVSEAIERQSIPAWLTLLTSMFMHGGWMHLIGNLVFLWIFGNNVEDAMGRLRFVVFYLLTGLAASAGHILSEPGSTIPTLGASGAISGVLGAYLVLYPRARILTLVPLGFIITTIHIPAMIFLPLWFLMQVVNLFGVAGGGVAWWAHVAGFVAGAVLCRLFESSEHRKRNRTPRGFKRRIFR